MRALVIGSSGGIGGALCSALFHQGHDVVGLSRSGDGLDITDEASILGVFAKLEGEFDRILVATGALELNGAGPEKSLRGLDAAVMTEQFRLNALGPVLILKHAVRLLPRKQPSCFAALSARVGSIGDNALGGWHSYRAAKAALNQYIHTAAIEIARSHPLAIVAALHPGHVATPLSLKYGANLPAVSTAEAANNILQVLAGLSPADSGGFFDWKGEPIPW